MEYLLGSTYGDSLKGDGVHNVLLSGGAGNDYLQGGAGSDYFIGGAGLDVVSYANALAPVVADLSINGVQNTVGAGLDQMAEIEYLIGSDHGDTLRGDGVHNVLLWGGAGNDQIQGGAGSDYLVGGAGFDAVSFANAAAGVNVDLSITGIQNTGGAGLDTLVEMEYLLGSAFNDVLKGDGVHNVLLSGGSGNDSLQGGAGADYLLGGAGIDTVIGGAGADTLVGGDAADTFIFSNISDFAPGPILDVITDFKTAQSDKINLSGVDANAVAANDQAFSFIGTAAFSNVAGQLRYAANGAGGVNVEGDTDGNGVADFRLVLDSTVSVTATDFIL
jgi:serralysin